MLHKMGTGSIRDRKCWEVWYESFSFSIYIISSSFSQKVGSSIYTYICQWSMHTSNFMCFSKSIFLVSQPTGLITYTYVSKVKTVPNRATLLTSPFQLCLWRIWQIRRRSIISFVNLDANVFLRIFLQPVSGTQECGW